MKRYCECRGTMVHSIGACIGCEDKPEPTEVEPVDGLAEKVGDLVRDAFYEACEAMQTWNGVLGPMSQDEMFAAWMESKSRAQLVAAFPELTESVRTP